MGRVRLRQVVSQNLKTVGLTGMVFIKAKSFKAALFNFACRW
jgi:hypothetical protein